TICSAAWEPAVAIRPNGEHALARHARQPTHGDARPKNHVIPNRRIALQQHVDPRSGEPRVQLNRSPPDGDGTVANSLPRRRSETRPRGPLVDGNRAASV